MIIAKEILEAMGYGDIKSIAEQCGVSRETVRRTLKGEQNRPDVVEAAIEHIETKLKNREALAKRAEALRNTLMGIPSFADLANDDPDGFEIELLNAAVAGV